MGSMNETDPGLAPRASPIMSPLDAILEAGAKDTDVIQSKTKAGINTDGVHVNADSQSGPEKSQSDTGILEGIQTGPEEGAEGAGEGAEEGVGGIDEFTHSDNAAEEPQEAATTSALVPPGTAAVPLITPGPVQGNDSLPVHVTNDNSTGQLDAKITILPTIPSTPSSISVPHSTTSSTTSSSTTKPASTTTTTTSPTTTKTTASTTSTTTTTKPTTTTTTPTASSTPPPPPPPILVKDPTTTTPVMIRTFLASPTNAAVPVPRLPTPITTTTVPAPAPAPVLPGVVSYQPPGADNDMSVAATNISSLVVVNPGRLGDSTGTGSSTAALVVPAVLGFLLVLSIVVILVLIRRRKRFKHRHSRRAHDAELNMPLQGTGKGEILYAKVDKSKKRKTPNDDPEELIPLTELAPSVACPSPETCGEQDNKAGIADDNTTGYSTHDSKESDSIHFVENDLYEPADEETNIYTSVDEPSKQTVGREVTRSSVLVPIPKHNESSEESESEDSDFEDLPPEAPRPPMLTRRVRPEEYIEPCCHDHPLPGPGWKPFREYDPVYVPSDHPSRKIDNFVDSANYITGRKRAESVNPYEEIQYGGAEGVAPPSADTSTDYSNPFGSGGLPVSPSEDAPPVAPRRRESRQALRPPPQRPEDIPPKAPERRESKGYRSSQMGSSGESSSSKDKLSSLAEEPRYSGLLPDDFDATAVPHKYTSLNAADAQAAAAAIASDPGSPMYDSPPMEPENVSDKDENKDGEDSEDYKDEAYEPVEFNQ